MGLLDDAIREHLELKRRRGADTAEVARQEREILGQSEPGETPAPAYDAAEAPAYDEPVASSAYPEVDAEPLAADLGYDDAYDAPAEPLAGAPLIEADPEPAPPADPAGRPATEIFPGTGELMAAAAESAGAPTPPPAAPAAPAPTPAASDDAARTGARRLSDEELAAWRKRLSERADRLAAGRPGGATAPAAGTDPAPAATPRPPAPATPAAEQPPAYWSGAAPATPAAGAPDSPAPAEDPGVPVDFFDAGDAATAFDPEPAPEPTPEADADHDVLDETPEFLQETPEHDRMWFEQRPPRDFDFG